MYVIYYDEMNFFMVVKLTAEIDLRLDGFIWKQV